MARLEANKVNAITPLQKACIVVEKIQVERKVVKREWL